MTRTSYTKECTDFRSCFSEPARESAIVEPFSTENSAATKKGREMLLVVVLFSCVGARSLWFGGADGEVPWRHLKQVTYTILLVTIHGQFG